MNRRCPCVNCSGQAWPTLESLTRHQQSQDFLRFLSELLFRTGGQIPSWIEKQWNYSELNRCDYCVYVVDDLPAFPPEVHAIPGQGGIPLRFPCAVPQDLHQRQVAEASKTRDRSVWDGWRCLRPNCFSTLAKFESRRHLFDHWVEFQCVYLTLDFPLATRRAHPAFF